MRRAVDGGGPSVRRGVRVAVDVGSVRVGVARCDPDGILATPVETVRRTRDDDGTAHIAAIVAELEAFEVVVGLPRSLDGRNRQAASLARSYAGILARLVSPVPVRMVDERFTSATAHQAMTASGLPGRSQRAVVDQVAAVIVLQHALDIERSTGREPGQLVQPRGTSRGGHDT
ncbi:Holliday junction resolvase RuvX [Litorihabitans aurantiacus]|uniref:Holliday junction resolvase RuvX n=1 Tax=Litorihabitans aurantiacus TaxID=1930061 RepID=UPI0024E07B3B|nr:Holliday junction resolvase RuvX [Litorihabitans aurantiacus]